MGINTNSNSLPKYGDGLSVQNGTNTIQTSYTVSGCGLDFVQTSVRLCQRGGSPIGTAQPATFNISGLPTCCTIEKAFFYTGGSGPGPTMSLSFTNPLGGNGLFPMVANGFSTTDKWGGYGGTWCRRADVTSLITGNGNYVISGIPTGSPNDPDGGTLIIIYSDNSQSFTGSMVLADGCQASGGGGNLTSNISGFSVCANPTLTRHFILAGDLQSIGPYNILYNSATTSFVYPAAGQQFYAYLPFTGSPVTAGQTTATYGINNTGGDAFALYVAGLYYRTTCNTCPLAASGLTVTPSTTLSCSSSTAAVAVTGGSGPLTFSWSPGGQTTQTVTGLGAGSYTVFVNNPSTCKTGSAVVTVTASASALTVNSSSICAGGSVTLTASGATTYTWNPALTLSSANGASVIATPSVTTNYTITGTAGACTGSAVATVTVTPNPTITITPTLSSICPTTSSTLTASGATNYTWSPSATLSSSTGSLVVANPTTTTIYTVTGSVNSCTNSATTTVSVLITPTLVVTPNFSICSGTNGTLTASGATTYTWSPALTLSSANGATVIATPTVTTIYTVTGTNAGGCTNTTTTSITVGALSISVNDIIPLNCASNTTLIASGATNYTWSPASTLSSANGTTVFATPTANTIYTVVGTNGICVGTTTVAVNIVSTLTATTTQTNVTCFGGNNGVASVTVSGSTPPYNYSWSTIPTQTTQTATGLTAGTYSVVITNTTCTASGNELVTNGTFNSGNSGFSSSYIFTPPPNTAASEYFIGDAVQLSSWNGGMFSAGDHTSGSGNFMMVNGSGTPGTNVYCQTIPVSPNTNYNFSTWVSSLNTGIAAQLQFYINGVPLGSIFNAPVAINTWSQFFQVWNSGASTSANICIVNQNSSLGGNDFGLDDISFQECLTPCPITKTVTITEPANFTVTATSASACAGSSATLTASGATTYTWNASTNLNSANGTSVIATPSITETYTITGAVGTCTNTGITTVTVIPNPTITLTPTLSSICVGMSSTLTASGATNYTWSPSATLSSNTGSLVVANPTTTTIYTITGSTNSCTNTAITTVSVLANPTLTVTPSFSVCSGTTGTLNVSGANTYTWNNATNLSSANGGTVTSSTNTTETYTVIGTALNTCTNSAVTTITVITTPTITATTQSAIICPQGTTSLTSSGATNYTWSPASTLSSSSGSLVIASPVNTTTYSVIGANSSCTHTAQVVVTVTTSPVISVASTSICSTTSSTLSASGATNYTWTPSTFLNTNSGATVISTPPNSITYSVSGTSPLGCVGNNTVSVTVIPTPTLTIGASSLIICDGNTSTLTAGGASSYTWSPSASLSNSNASNPVASPITTTTYVVIGSNGTAPTVCTSFKTIQITVLPKTIPVVGPNDVICEGQNTTIYATGGNTYNWSPTTGVLHPHDSATVVSPSVTTVYTVTVSKNNLCPATSTIMVTVNPLPTVYAGKDSTINIDQEIVLTGTGNVPVGFLSPDGNPLICNWCSIVTVYPKEYTCYTLEGFNNFGCRNTDDVCITVTKDWDVFIPNAFTPNNDIDNEYFIPKGYGIETINLTIFDRWGSIIFKENDTKLGWDGKNKGKLCEQGVYIYQTEIISMGGETTTKTGHVTLLGKIK